MRVLHSEVGAVTCTADTENIMMKARNLISSHTLPSPALCLLDLSPIGRKLPTTLPMSGVGHKLLSRLGPSYVDMGLNCGQTPTSTGMSKKCRELPLTDSPEIRRYSRILTTTSIALQNFARPRLHPARFNPVMIARRCIHALVDRGLRRRFLRAGHDRDGVGHAVLLGPDHRNAPARGGGCGCGRRPRTRGACCG